MRYILLLLSVILISCKKELNINLEDPSKKIVLYPILSNYKKIEIRMSGATGILSNFPHLENPFTIISDNGEIIDTVYINQKGKGYSRFTAIPNHNYTFSAFAKGFPMATCELNMPLPLETFTVDTFQIYKYMYGIPPKYLLTTLNFKDNPNSTDYYRITIYTKCIRKSTVYVGQIPHDTTYVYYNKPQLGANISEDGFFFYYGLSKYFLAEEVINFNDAMNFTYDYEGDRFYEGGEFYLTDNEFNGKNILLKVMVNQQINTNQPERYIIELSRVPEETYFGLKSFATYGTKEQLNLPVSEEVSIYSSVTGGYGFPICYSSVIDSSYWMIQY